jgi:hypothetical protein
MNHKMAASDIQAHSTNLQLSFSQSFGRFLCLQAVHSNAKLALLDADICQPFLSMLNIAFCMGQTEEALCFFNGVRWGCSRRKKSLSYTHI